MWVTKETVAETKATVAETEEIVEGKAEIATKSVRFVERSGVMAGAGGALRALLEVILGERSLSAKGSWAMWVAFVDA